jgi:hypothetical protein
VSLRPSTSRFSSPGTWANSFPPLTISEIAWSKGTVIHFPSPRFPARLITFVIRYGSYIVWIPACPFGQMAASTRAASAGEVFIERLGTRLKGL